MKNKLNIIIRFFKLNQLYMNSFGVGNMGKYVSSILGGIFIFIYFLFAGVDQFIVAFAISFGSYSFLHDIYTGKGHWYNITNYSNKYPNIINIPMTLT